MMFFTQNTEQESKPCTWKSVLVGKKKLRTVTFTCPKGHTYLLNKYEILANGSVLPAVLCPAYNCNFNEFIKLEGWESGVLEA